MNSRLTLPSRGLNFELSSEQSKSFADLVGHQLLLGAAGSGRTTTLLHATMAAVAKYGLNKTWVITSSRTSAESIKAKLVNLDPGSTPKVYTVSSLAYAMLRTHLLLKSAGERELTMLTGPQQEARIRQLVQQHSELWPRKWQQTVNTRVFTSDLRRFLDLHQNDYLTQLDSDVAKAVSEFASLFVNQTKSSDEVSYVEANYVLAKLLKNKQVLGINDYSPRAILIDDLHDFDLSQLELIIQLIKSIEFSFVTSNSDAAVLGFRGVGIENTKIFRDQISPKPNLLTQVFRHGEKIGSLVREFLPATVAPDLNLAEHDAIRKPSYFKSDTGEIEVQVSVSNSLRDKLIVDQIMHAKVEAGIDFADIAIIGRSFSTLANLRRALAEAAIPVEFAPDNVPLANDPAVSQLLNALILAVSNLDEIDQAKLIQFVLSDIVNMNAADLRYSAQQLRRLNLFGSTESVVVSAILSPAILSQLPFDPRLQPLRRAAVIFHTVRGAINQQTTIGEVLWSLWQAQTDPKLSSLMGYESDEDWQNWPTRLAVQAVAQSAAGRRADRDLDAVLALFDAADRADRNYQGSASVEEFIQEILAQDAASEVLIKRAVNGVAVLTAHRARGREWKQVFIVDLQEGVWPAANVRESIILPRDKAQQRQRLAEERRLIAAAVATAIEKIVLAVVDSKVDQGTAPSSLLAGFDLPKVITDFPPSVLTIRGLIAQLRAVTTDPSASEELKRAAISRLGYLAKLPDPRLKAAKPESWWFLPARTYSDLPLIDTTKPLQLSGSMLESITTCPTQWFFERKLGIKEQPIANTVVGIAIHAVAEKIINQALDLDQALAELEILWPRQVFEASWQSKLQFTEATQMVSALHQWVKNNNAEIKGTEVDFKVLHAELGVLLVGKIDLLQENDLGEIVISDFKTGASKPSKAELEEHAQLGVYQLAAQIDSEINPNQLPVAAKLIQIRLRNAKDQIVEQAAPPLNDPIWLIEQIDQAKTKLEREDLPARPGSHCRNCKVRTVCPAAPEGDQVAG